MNSTTLAGLVLGIVIASCSEGRKFKKLPSASDERVIESLERLHTEEILCLKKIDAILASRWYKEVKKIPTKDLGRIKADFVFEKEPSKPIYHTALQEWVMGSGSSYRRIGKCVKKLVDNVAPSLGQSDYRCLNASFWSHVEGEKKFERNFFRLLNISSRDQLPFRRFINFHEFTDLMFQSRNPDALTDTERSVYEHSESQLTAEDDKEKRIFTMQQHCKWTDARSLQEASSPNAKFKEFESQVRDSLNQRIGHYMIRTYPSVNLTLVRRRREKWLKVREAMGKRLKREISSLRTQKRSSQALCEYASDLSGEFFEEQSPFLTEDEEIPPLELRTEKIAKETRAVESVLKKKNDVRRASMNSLAKGVESDSRCLQAVSSLVKQHHLFQAASLFMDSDYTYPELHCNIPPFSSEIISPVVCNCVGSFCATYRLAVLIAKEYKMVRSKDGVYKVVRNEKHAGSRGGERGRN